jgi:hypothetical protein
MREQLRVSMSGRRGSCRSGAGRWCRAGRGRGVRDDRLRAIGVVSLPVKMQSVVRAFTADTLSFDENIFRREHISTRTR